MIGKAMLSWAHYRKGAFGNRHPRSWTSHISRAKAIHKQSARKLASMLVTKARFVFGSSGSGSGSGAAGSGQHKV